MKRPIVSLLIVILSGLLFPSCYKNDLRALYERWVNQVTLSGLHEDSTKKFKEVISKVSVEVGEGLEPKEEELRTIYVPSNTDAVITFKLNNQKKYYILPVLACEGLSPNIIAPASAEITDEITVTLAKAFLADNVGSFFDGTITLQEWGKDSLSTQKIRDFDKKINFRIIINLPPPDIKNLYLFKYPNNEGEPTFGLACKFTKSFTTSEDTKDKTLIDNILDSLKQGEVTFTPKGDFFGEQNNTKIKVDASAISIDDLSLSDEDYIGNRPGDDGHSILYINTGIVYGAASVDFDLHIKTDWDGERYKVWGGEKDTELSLSTNYTYTKLTTPIFSKIGNDNSINNLFCAYVVPKTKESPSEGELKAYTILPFAQLGGDVNVSLSYEVFSVYGNQFKYYQGSPYKGTATSGDEGFILPHPRYSDDGEMPDIQYNNAGYVLEYYASSEGHEDGEKRTIYLLTCTNKLELWAKPDSDPTDSWKCYSFSKYDGVNGQWLSVLEVIQKVNNPEIEYEVKVCLDSDVPQATPFLVSSDFDFSQKAKSLTIYGEEDSYDPKASNPKIHLKTDNFKSFSFNDKTAVVTVKNIGIEHTSKMTTFYCSNATTNLENIYYKTTNSDLTNYSNFVVSDRSNITIEDCYICAPDGGLSFGVKIDGVESSERPQITIKNTTFNNLTHALLSQNKNYQINIEGCTFKGKADCQNGSVIVLTNGTQATITNTNITNNRIYPSSNLLEGSNPILSVLGGAIVVGKDSHLTYSGGSISSNILTDTTSDNQQVDLPNTVSSLAAIGGGAILNQGGTVILSGDNENPLTIAGNSVELSNNNNNSTYNVCDHRGGGAILNAGQCFVYGNVTIGGTENAHNMFDQIGQNINNYGNNSYNPNTYSAYLKQATTGNYWVNTKVDGYGGAIYNSMCLYLGFEAIKNKNLIVGDNNNIVISQNFLYGDETQIGGGVYSNNQIIATGVEFNHNLNGALCLAKKPSSSIAMTYQINAPYNNYANYIENCVFTDNVQVADAEVSALYVSASGEHVVVNPMFTGNSVFQGNGDGGAIYIKGDSASDFTSAPELILGTSDDNYCFEFTRNSAMNKGGAIYCENAKLTMNARKDKVNDDDLALFKNNVCNKVNPTANLNNWQDGIGSGTNKTPLPSGGGAIYCLNSEFTVDAIEGYDGRYFNFAKNYHSNIGSNCYDLASDIEWVVSDSDFPGNLSLNHFSFVNFQIDCKALGKGKMHIKKSQLSYNADIAKGRTSFQAFQFVAPSDIGSQNRTTLNSNIIFNITKDSSQGKSIPCVHFFKKELDSTNYTYKQAYDNVSQPLKDFIGGVMIDNSWWSSNWSN